MRRKSTRNAQKATPDKPVKETESPVKTRRSKRRKRSPSKSSESEEEVITVTKRSAPEETPDTTTKSHTPSDDETSEEPVWKVTSSEDVPKGEIQKLKICLTRPCPDSPDKNKTRRSKSNSQTEDDATSSEDKSSTKRTRSRGSPFVRNDGMSSQEGDEDMEEKKGKGKSKGKHKSKIEKSPHLSEPEIQTNNEISENVQVTPQSPSIDKPVDNENDYNKVDADDIQNVKENTQNDGNTGEGSAISIAQNIDDKQNELEIVKDISETQDNNNHKSDNQDKESDDDEPLSVIQKLANEEKQNKSDITQTVNNDGEIKDNEAQSVENKEQENQESLQDPEPEPQNVTEQKMETQESEETQPENKEETKSEETSDKNEEPLQIQTEVMEVAEEPSPPMEVTITEEVIAEIEPQESSCEIEEKSSEPETKLDESKPSDETVIEAVVRSSTEILEVPSSSSKTVESHQDDNEQTLRRRLKRNNESSTSDSKEESPIEYSTRIKPAITKRKWETSTNLSSSLFKVDLETIQSVCPTIEFPEEPDLKLDVEKERRKSSSESSSKKIERKVSVEYKLDISDKPSYEKQSSVGSSTQDSEDNSNIIAFNRKISIVDDTASKLRPPPSPAKNPTSDVLYITNLVRPFTLKQLKELLERTGKIKEEGFWTDRIKSKCYVQYETAEEAEATRNALHGVQWPIGNGKKLIIDYATVADLENAKNPPAPPPTAPAPELKISAKENVEPVESKTRSEEKPAKEAEKKRSEGPVREWDIGKKDVRRERSRSRDRNRKHRRSPTPTDDFISRKQRKVEEAVPQKLMDDLFLKTKATPSIYWQPLSPEEISMKQQQRLIRMEEHKRRMEENSRLKGRDIGRGAFRRRYD